MKINSIRDRLLASTMVGGAALMALTAASVVTLAAPTAALAQDYTSGVLSGAVSDASGAPAAGASVTVTSAQGTVRTATTDANGSFRMPALPVGAYTVRIEQSGFATINQRASVSPGGASYAFTLTPAGADGASTLEDVIVTAQRVQDFTATDTGLTVDVQEFSDRVPVGRSINAVTLFTPGASAPDASINASSRRNQSLVSLSGTSAAESAYYINGMNVTDQRTFLGYGELPFDFIQTIDTKTGGYAAEYGRGTGGVVNIVTRSGTNEWTGGASVFWTPSSLTSERGVTYQQGGNNQAGVQVYNQYASTETKDYTVFLGGPIIRDHLFFFGTYNIRDVESEGARTRVFNYTGGAIAPAGTMSQVVSAYDDPRWALKLDFVINPDHRIEATIINDETTTVSHTKTFSATTLAQTAITAPLFSEAGGLTQIYKYTGVFTDWFTLSASYGRLENSYLDYGDRVNIPGVVDAGRPASATPGDYRPAFNVTNGRQGGPFNLAGEDVREVYRVDADFYVSLFGDHHFRVGYDREDLTSLARTAYSGGALYTAYGLALTGDPDDETCPLGITGPAGCINVYTFANDGTFTAEQTAFYLQDSWEITPNLSVQMGVRNDRYDYKNIDGQSYIALEDQWAPRLGFNWDPFGNGLDRVYGSVGDYYLPIATNTSIRASSGEVFTDEYYQAVRDANGDLVMDASGYYPVLGPRLSITYNSPPGAPDPRSVVEADLKPMYEREYVLGYEHKFTDGMFADWSVGVRGVYRNLESAIEDTGIGDAIYRYCVRTNQVAACSAGVVNPDSGLPVDIVNNVEDRQYFVSRYPYVLINPGDGATVFVDLQGDSRTIGAAPNPAYSAQTINLTAADLAMPEVERTYKALEFTFERPFDGTWGLQGSYTWAESKGNYEGAVKSDIGQTDTSITQDYDHAANTLGAYGYTPNHRAHTFKIFGSYAPTDRMNVGASFVAQSGRKYGCIGRVPLAVDPLAPQAGTPSGWYCPFGPGNSSIQTPRGSQGETPWTYQVDLNLSYDILRTENRGNLQARLEVFNLFDNDQTTRVVEQGLIRTSGNDLSLRAPYYGMARSLQSPRQVRLGLRYSF